MVKSASANLNYSVLIWTKYFCGVTYQWVIPQLQHHNLKQKSLQLSTKAMSATILNGPDATCSNTITLFTDVDH
jgi:hypothetical protein